MKLSIIFIALLFILSSCNPRAAIDPWSYAPPCYDRNWNPAPCQKDEIPKCLLMESAECDEGCVENNTTLCDLIDLALRKSPATKITWAKARIAASEYGIGQSPFYPELDFDTFWLAIKTPGFFGGSEFSVNTFQEYAPYLSLSYLVWDFGTTRAQSQALYQSLLAANWSHNQEIQRLMTDVTLDYYTYITDQEKLLAGVANLHDAETTLNATEAKHGRGITNITDVLTAKTELAKQTIQLITDEQAVADSLAMLLAETGLPANACIHVESFADCIDEDEFLTSVDNFICLAYEARPDLYSAYARVLSDEANLKAAQRQQLPQVTFNGDVGEYFFNPGNLSDYGYNATFSLNFPIFQGWYYKNQIREAKAELQLSQAELRAVEVQMVKDVVTSYQDFYFATDLVKVNKEYVCLAEETFNANLAEYKMGTIDITTLVNSQTNLADARYSLADAKKQWYDALANLTFATGTVTRCR